MCCELLYTLRSGVPCTVLHRDTVVRHAHAIRNQSRTPPKAHTNEKRQTTNTGQQYCTRQKEATPQPGCYTCIYQRYHTHSTPNCLPPSRQAHVRQHVTHHRCNRYRPSAHTTRSDSSLGSPLTAFYRCPILSEDLQQELDIQRVASGRPDCVPFTTTLPPKPKCNPCYLVCRRCGVWACLRAPGGLPRRLDS